MPLHDFRCTACGEHFEQLVRASSAPSCPHCHSSALEKLLSAPAPQGTSQAIVAAGRRAAAREGHFSHYSAAERAKTR
jgi:putative FmdB family regulatory protein